MRDTDRFDDFYRGTRDRLLRYLYAAGGDLGEAQEAAQEAYLRAWQRWYTVQGLDDPEAWVRTVGWRILANRRRKLGNRLRAHRRHGPPAALPPPSEDTVALVRALRRLPVEQRRAIVLHHLLDLPLAQVATETDAPAGTVKARLARGRRALAELLAIEPTEADHA